METQKYVTLDAPPLDSKDEVPLRGPILPEFFQIDYQAMDTLR